MEPGETERRTAGLGDRPHGAGLGPPPLVHALDPGAGLVTAGDGEQVPLPDRRVLPAGQQRVGVGIVGPPGPQLQAARQVEDRLVALRHAARGDDVGYVDFVDHQRIVPQARYR